MVLRVLGALSAAQEIEHRNLTIPARERTRKGRVWPKKPVFEPQGPSDPPPPGTEPQYLDRGRGKS